MGYFMPLLVVGTSIWVAIDASNLGARKGLVPGFWNMGAAGWFFACVLLWIVAFPGYLINREKIKTAAQRSAFGGGQYPPGWTPQWQPQWQAPAPTPARPPLSTTGWTNPTAVPVTPPPARPGPDWYVDPDDHSLLRWWDGSNWSEHKKRADPL